MTQARLGSLRFGAFLLNLDRRALTCSGQPVPLTPKAFEVLRVLALAGCQSRIVSRNELVDAVWGETIVEESNLTQTIFLLRQALRHFDARDYIETVPRQGYLFRGGVRVIPDASSQAIAQEIKSRWPAPYRWTVMAASAILVMSLAINIWRRTGTKPDTEDRETYNLYLRGRHFWNMQSDEGFREATRLFEQAVRRDPDFALGWAGLADTWWRYALWQSAPPGDSVAKARRATQRALALAPRRAEPHASLATILCQFDWDWAGSEREFRRSLEIDPGQANTWHWYSHYLVSRGRFSESLTASRKAIELAPVDVPINSHLGWHYYYARDYKKAIEAHRKALMLLPSHGQTRAFLGLALLGDSQCEPAIAELRAALDESPERISYLGHALGSCGQTREAHIVIERMRKLDHERYVSPQQFAFAWAGLKDMGETLAALEHAADTHAANFAYVAVEPAFDFLHNEPRFKVLLERLGIPESSGSKRAIP
jgi:DNA-binding winged helix-turn-helix (wHTH) protein/Flp pilus assembly protein TadD